jgi:hypothetical protein
MQKLTQEPTMTEWNDAIEAATLVAQECDRNDERDNGAAATGAAALAAIAILTLRRPAGDDGWRKMELGAQLSEVPDDAYGAFAWFVSRCSSGLYRELLEDGRSDTEARNSVIHLLLSFASGEACRIARREGREPDCDKWRKATDTAFENAAKRSARQSLPPAP